MSDIANKVETLMEAMPYLQKYQGKIIVIKYGGNAMINEELKDAVMHDVVLLKLLGMKPVLSHGGGPGINKMLDYVYDHYDIFKLLLCKSEGTPFTSFIHNIVEREVASTDRYIELMRKSGKDMPYIDPELQHMIASGQFSGVFEIVVHDMEKEAAIRKVMMLKEFYTAGWERLFGISF